MKHAYQKIKVGDVVMYKGWCWPNSLLHGTVIAKEALGALRLAIPPRHRNQESHLKLENNDELRVVGILYAVDVVAIHRNGQQIF